MHKHMKITAIIQEQQFDDVLTKLVALGIEGLTATSVKGFGEWHPRQSFGYGKTFNKLSDHTRLEIFIESDRADAVIDAITKAAHTGEAGDGVIALLPIERFVHVRSHYRDISSSDDDQAPPSEGDQP